MMGFYRKLIPKCSEISERMRLTQKGSFISNESERQAFSSVIRELNDAFALPHSQPNSTYYQLVTDCSNHAVGAAL